MHVFLSVRLLRITKHFQQLKGKDQNCASRDGAASTAISIAELTGDVKLPFATFLHQLHRFCPTLDHLIGSKREWFATLVRGVKGGSVNQGTAVVAFAGTVDRRALSYVRYNKKGECEKSTATVLQPRLESWTCLFPGVLPCTSIQKVGRQRRLPISSGQAISNPLPKYQPLRRTPRRESQRGR